MSAPTTPVVRDCADVRSPEPGTSWTRGELLAALAVATGPTVELEAPHTVSLNGLDGRGRGDRLVLWFDFGAVETVNAWMAWLKHLGVEPAAEVGTGRVYPADLDFRVYRAETERWAGWRVTLQCRVSGDFWVGPS